MNESKDIEVVTLDGSIVTYEEHCRRVEAYLEEIKKEAVKLTQANAALTTFFQGIKLVADIHPELEHGICRYYLGLESNEHRTTPGDVSQWSSSTGLDESGRPLLVFDDLSIKSGLRLCLVHDFFLPRLVRNLAYYQRLIKDILEGDLKWDYLGSERREKCLELKFLYRDTDIFWLVLNKSIKVLIGTYDDIKESLIKFQDRYAEGDIFFVDTGEARPDEAYADLFTNVLPSNRSPQFTTDQKYYAWTRTSFGVLFDLKFRSQVEHLNAIFNIGIRETYLLGQLLTDTLDYQDKLIQELRALQTGDGNAYEDLVKRVLTFCFHEDFVPFVVKEQVVSDNRKRKRDFIIDNRQPKEEFWRHLKSRGVEKILFDAKNYADKISSDEIASTLRYLKNPAFGNFMIIVSRKGVKDYKEFIEDYSQTKQVVLFLTDEHLIAMINAKQEGESPTSIIEEVYYDFLDKK